MAKEMKKDTDRDEVESELARRIGAREDEDVAPRVPRTTRKDTEPPKSDSDDDDLFDDVPV